MHYCPCLTVQRRPRPQPQLDCNASGSISYKEMHSALRQGLSCSFSRGPPSAAPSPQPPPTPHPAARLPAPAPPPAPAFTPSPALAPPEAPAAPPNGISAPPERVAAKTADVATVAVPSKTAPPPPTPPRPVYPRSASARRERYRVAAIWGIADREHRKAEWERHLVTSRDRGVAPAVLRSMHGRWLSQQQQGEHEHLLLLAASSAAATSAENGRAHRSSPDESFRRLRGVRGQAFIM